MTRLVLLFALCAGTATAAAAQAAAPCGSTRGLCIAPLDDTPVVQVSSGTALPSPFSVAPGGPDRPVIRPVPLVGVFR